MFPPSSESAGIDVPIIWQGRRARAFVPTLLAERDLTLATETIARSATAGADVAHAAAALPQDYEALARLLLRAEGVASSFIEGVRAWVVDVVLAEENAVGRHTPAAWIAANLAAVSEAVAAAHAGPLSVDLLCQWHRTLMTGTPTPERHVGAVRTEQGWIGGTSPLDAHLVTPPPERLAELLDDVVAYANRGDVDAVAQAAVAHAQFEVIHPFADGNGRIGRVLVGWILTRRLSLVTPPPVSASIAADVGGYSSGLTLFRLGQLDPWVRWFAEAVSSAGRAQSALVDRVEALRLELRSRLGTAQVGRAMRSDAAAWRVIDLLPRHLVLTSDVVASELNLTRKAATTALQRLAEAGVLREHGTRAGQGRGRPARLYVSLDLLGLAGSSRT